MLTNLKRYLEHLLATTDLGTFTEFVVNNHYIVIIAAFTEETINTLWVKVVFELSDQGLTNGILDVPMVQVNNRVVIIWVKSLPIICCSQSDQISEIVAERAVLQPPTLPPSICLAIGGPSGVGKTKLIERLQDSSIGHRVKRYVAYTTRPRRPHEVDGVDYFFVDPVEFDAYRCNPRFINFVEARGYWYWSDPVTFFESRWRDKDLVHVFAITQVHEFIERHHVIPDLLWVWLSASEEELHRRLEKRGDSDIEKSIVQNQRLVRQDRTGLVSLELNMETDSIDNPLCQLIEFIASTERK